jgi:ribonuclease BN (tRNA processing enzyme)
MLGFDLLRRKVPRVEVLFSHFHMDHLFGFPFFGPIYSPSCEVTVGVPAYSGVDAQNKIGRYLNGIYHPVRIRDVAAKIHFEGVRPGRTFERGPYRISAVALNHPGGSCGYRIECEGQVVVYLTDTAPLSRPDVGMSADKPPPSPELRVLKAMSEADLMIMDTMFSFDEYLEKMTWGHAYPEYAVMMAKAAGVKRVALFHHAPDATDEALDALGAFWAHHREPEVFLAKEGLVMDLSG